MMSSDGALRFSVVSVMEDVLQQHDDNRPCDLDFDSRRAEEAGITSYLPFSYLFNSNCDLGEIV